jgi:hypothetical protein
MEVTHYGDYSTSLASIQSLPTNGREQLTLQLVHTLESTAETGFTLWILGDYIQQLPARIGHARALDVSIQCLLSTHKALQTPQNVDQVSTLNNYGQALRLLNSALDSPTQEMETIVAAAIALGDVEVGIRYIPYRDLVNPC